MNKLQVLVKCFTGPRLYFLSEERKDGLGFLLKHVEYDRSVIERLSDIVFDGYSWLVTIVKYLSPFIIISIYKHGIVSYIPFIRSSAVPLLTIYLLIFVLRGTARFLTPDYIDFITNYNTASLGNNISRHSFLRKYDFDFSYWKHDYSATVKASFNNSVDIVNIPFTFKPFYHVMATWVGKPLAFPGSTYLVNRIIRSQLDAGRVAYMLNGRFTRAKLKTIDNNFIDSGFVDNRGHGNGDTLVITCEGNAGFYEVGCFEIPLKAGYSTLGWNHPGFGYSTGIPFDKADANAIEAVYQYATEHLGFSPQNIIVYGWSIGGYPVSYIAQAHKDIGGIILDASFDDIVPLALPRMPDFLTSITVSACRNYFNLQNVKLVTQYLGPIRIIRRNSDEIITTDLHRSSNRGNDLLKAILESRYPTIFRDESVVAMVDEWLNEISPIARQRSIPGLYDLEFCRDQIALLSPELPHETLGEGFSELEKIMMAYYLFSHHFTDCEGGHNIPLPQKYFRLPWKYIHNKDANSEKIG